MKTITVPLSFVLALACAGPVRADTQDTTQSGAANGGPPAFWTFLTDWFQVREAFDGGKAEDEAGAIGLVAPGRNSPTYWLLDAGVRVTPQDVRLNSKGDFELFYFPAVEWHHLSAEPLLKQDAVNKAGPSFNAELWFPPRTSLGLRTYITGKGSVQRNFINDATENSVRILLGACAEGVVPTGDGWENGFRPCAELVYNGARRFHYYPYIGFEHYAKLALVSSGTTIAPAFTGSLFLIRFQADAYPLNTEVVPGNIQGLVLNVDYTYHRALDDVLTLDSRNLNALKFSATYFFVKGQVVGVGLDLALGRTPDVNFVSQRRAVLALRIKTKH